MKGAKTNLPDWGGDVSLYPMMKSSRLKKTFVRMSQALHHNFCTNPKIQLLCLNDFTRV